MGTEALQFRADIIGQRATASYHGSSQSEWLRMWQGVKVSKEGAKNAAFVPTLSELPSDPCGGDVAWGQSQQLLATMAGREPHDSLCLDSRVEWSPISVVLVFDQRMECDSNLSECFRENVGSCNMAVEALQNEEESGEPEQAAGDAPPPYSSISAESAAYFDYKDESGFPKPPSYNVATTLPSYDEAERTKAEATIPLVPGRVSIICHGGIFLVYFLGKDRRMVVLEEVWTCLTSFPSFAFAVAFLFNWIGFFLSFCLTTSAAGRYGAISGFGLSLIKWILIVRFFFKLGFLLFLRGFINYAKVRKMPETFSNLPRTRVLFIY
ncbi:PREDICTED: NEDD4 family-interacting protein 1 [Colobus angolensis palliatus]|uniref:NEDD4 family-interacting protein 1 n=1 Tax=Colobus angolensis palliatus TaxID=336983 RepID=UPI0005F43D41|nr:PREDICTED: NEDD4 family-interacting protein 1 [Colobus angolensis palliatus]